MEAIEENQRRIAAAIGVDPSDFTYTHQTHTTNVAVVEEKDRGGRFLDTDGMVTNVPGICLVTFYADCVPLFFVDSVHRAIGLSHSGWRGTVGRMGQATLKLMEKQYGTDPEQVVAAIGPSICQDCYEVSEDVALAFAENFVRDDAKAVEYLGRYQRDYTQTDIENCLMYRKENGKYQLNLWYANFRVFRDAGVPDQNIEVTDVCTCCNPSLLFSHRASGGKRGNLGAFMMLK